MSKPKPKRSDYPDTSAGEIAWLADSSIWKRESAKAKGRAALDGAEPHKPKPGTADPEEELDPDKPRLYRQRRVPRYNAKGELVWTVNGVPEDCPVIPLGADGLSYYYLAPRGQLISLGEGKFGLTHIKQLFGKRIPYAEEKWPKFNKQGTHTGFAAENIADALIMAADAKGVFDPRDKVRGRGCWRGPNGELIQHLGDRVLISGDGATREEKPGEIAIPIVGMEDGEDQVHVYPGRPKLPAPKAGGKADCGEIYDRLKSWQWIRGDLDARLLLGWMACIVLGSALDWRPMVFWMGDAGTGKSTLQRYVRELLYGRLISTVDASAAALRQVVGMDSLGVSFDELEADQNNDQAKAVLKIARCAASGEKSYRGGADHKAAEFMLQGCFGFSAIVPPAMGQADTQRFAFLRLRKLPKGAKTPKWSIAELRQLGAGMVGRITEGWDRWQEVLDLYKTGLEKVGHEQRGQDQFGTLLAAAYVLLSDDVPDSDSVAVWCDQLRRDRVAEYEQSETAAMEAFNRILSAQPEAWRHGGSHTVGQKLTKYWWAWKDAQHPDRSKTLRRMNEDLVRGGLAIVHAKATDEPWLAIPPKGQAISEIFKGHNYHSGAWTNALRGADPWDPATREGVWKADNCRALGHVKCTLYRLEAVVDGRPIFDPGPAPSEGPETMDDDERKAA